MLLEREKYRRKMLSVKLFVFLIKMVLSSLAFYMIFVK